jgi:hypothetical protein
MAGRQKNVDEELIVNLAAGRSYRAIEGLMSISRATIIRRMRNPDFRRRVRQARQDYLQRALGHLARGSTDAAIVLRNLLRSVDPKVRLGAAKAILDSQARFHEIEDLTTELNDLKEQIAQMQAANKRVQACRFGQN